MGLPYVLSSDLVSAYPAKSLEIAQYVDGLIPLLAMTQNAQTGVTYSFVLTDFTKLVTLSNASAVAVTLPLEATVAWPTGTQLRLLNQGAGTVTVAGAVGVTINGSPLTLTQYKGANLIKTGTNVWTFVPFASGVGAAEFSDANTGTYTGFAYKTFSSSSTLTVTTAGFADVLVLGGGGGGGIGGGGGGGTGGASTDTTNFGQPGGSGGGAGYSTSGTSPGGVGQIGQGSTGGTTALTTAGGGGGGTGAVGSNGVANVGGAGGNGTTTSIAGTTPTGAYVAGAYAYGGGGGGGGATTGGAGGSGGGGTGASNTSGMTAGAANKGGGGGGRYGAAPSAAGGSGIVIVRVAV